MAGSDDVPEPGSPISSLDEAEYARWHDTASSNFESAQREARAGAHHVAVFLAEQASQCALKAVLHGIGATTQAFGHGLVQLGDALAEELSRDIPGTVHEAMQRLAQAYMPSRYPDALPAGSPRDNYGASDADRAISEASSIREWADQLWSELRAADAADPPGNPGR